MAELAIFTIIAVAACAFLIYFMFALWRDSRSSQPGTRIEIRKLPRRRGKYKLLRLYSAEDLRVR